MAGLNFGALIGAQQQNPLAQFADALAQVPQMQQQSQMDKIAVQNARQQLKAGDQQIESNDFNLQQQKQQALQQQWEFAGNMIKSRPQYAQDPNMIQKVTGLANQLGMPVPLDENGHIDPSVWQTPFDGVDPKQKEAIINDWLEKTPGPVRDAAIAAAGFSGVPDAIRTAPQSFGAKEQAALMRAKAAGLKAEEEGPYLAARAAFERAHTHFLNGIADATDQKILAEAQKARADATADLQRGQAALLQGQAAMKRAENGFSRSRLGGNYGTAVMRGTKAQVDAARKLVDDQIGPIQQRIRILSANSDDPANDPDINALNAQLQQLQTQKIQLDQAYQDSVEYLTSNTGLVTSLQGQSGKKVTSVVDATHKKDPYTVGAVYARKNADGSTTYATYLGSGQWQIKQ